MFINGLPVDSPQVRSRLGIRQSLKPFQAQQFGEDEGALAQMFDATGGAPPEQLRGGFSHVADAMRMGRKREPAEGWGAVWSGLGANSEARGYFNSIFESLDPRGLALAARKGRVGKLEKFDRGFADEFMSGAQSYLQDPGEWEWDFDQNRWGRTNFGLGVVAKRQAASNWQSIRQNRKQSTMSSDFGSTNIKKTKV